MDDKNYKGARVPVEISTGRLLQLTWEKDSYLLEILKSGQTLKSEMTCLADVLSMGLEKEELLQICGLSHNRKNRDNSLVR